MTGYIWKANLKEKFIASTLPLTMTEFTQAKKVIKDITKLLHTGAINLDTAPKAVRRMQNSWSALNGNSFLTYVRKEKADFVKQNTKLGTNGGILSKVQNFAY